MFVRILVVEDHAVLAREVATGLRRDGFAVDIARDGEEAIEKTDVNDYDVVVLDRDLPKVHGDDVCRHVASRKDGPRIIMLTAAGSLGDIVDGLNLGADDYLSKPFAMAELDRQGPHSRAPFRSRASARHHRRRPGDPSRRAQGGARGTADRAVAQGVWRPRGARGTARRRRLRRDAAGEGLGRVHRSADERCEGDHGDACAASSASRAPSSPSRASATRCASTRSRQ